MVGVIDRKCNEDSKLFFPIAQSLASTSVFRQSKQSALFGIIGTEFHLRVPKLPLVQSHRRLLGVLTMGHYTELWVPPTKSGHRAAPKRNINA